MDTTKLILFNSDHGACDCSECERIENSHFSDFGSDEPDYEPFL